MRTAEEYKKLSIREFDKAAERYETDRAGIYEMCQHDYPPILEELRSKPFETLLDAGCGTAPMLSLLADEYPERRYTGLDLSPAMIEQAKKKKLSNAEFVVGDCENMPFDANSFDVIINSQSFHHYPNPQDFFNSVYKCLKPGGWLILRDNTGPEFLVRLVNLFEMPLVNLFGHGDVGVYTIEEIKTFCGKAGLLIDKIEQQKGFRLHLVARKPE